MEQPNPNEISEKWFSSVRSSSISIFIYSPWFSFSPSLSPNKQQMMIDLAAFLIYCMLREWCHQTPLSHTSVGNWGSLSKLMQPSHDSANWDASRLSRETFQQTISGLCLVSCHIRPNRINSVSFADWSPMARHLYWCRGTSLACSPAEASFSQSIWEIPSLPCSPLFSVPSFPSWSPKSSVSVACYLIHLSPSPTSLSHRYNSFISPVSETIAS